MLIRVVYYEMVLFEIKILTHGKGSVIINEINHTKIIRIKIVGFDVDREISTDSIRK